MHLEELLPLVALAIPILAVTGGIIAGIVRAVGQQRLIELAHRERIAAIERGIDPSKLPPLPVPDDCCGPYGSPDVRWMASRSGTGAYRPTTRMSIASAAAWASIGRLPRPSMRTRHEHGTIT